MSDELEMQALIVEELVKLNNLMEVLVKEHLTHFKEWRESDARRNK